MKRIFYALVTFSVLLYSSCGKSFLEIDPVGSLTGEKIFTDVVGYEAGLAGAYSLFAKYHLGPYGFYGELRGDNIHLFESQAAGYLLEFNYESDGTAAIGMVAGIWRSIYETLNNVNNIIEARDQLLENFPQRSREIQKIYGQALALRAICHFDLSNVYSQHYTYSANGSHLGLPVLTTTPAPGSSVSRPSIKDTYQQIISDLTQASEILAENPTDNKIYVSSDAAKALLSRIYLYMENWDSVIAQANPLLESNKYPLTAAANYVNMFTDPSQRKTYSSIDKEVIWQLNLLQNSSTYLTNIFSEKNNFIAYPHKSYVGLFEDSDFRKQQFESSTRQAGVFFSVKYGLQEGTLADQWPINFKMFRSAELYLNLAEAYFHKQQYAQAEEQLRILRARAYDLSPDAVAIDYSTPAQLLDQIKLERRKELGFENQRIFDIMRYKENLNRTDCQSNTCQLSYPNDKFILPIPQMEIDANPAMQPNPGYN